MTREDLERIIASGDYGLLADTARLLLDAYHDLEIEDPE